MTAEPRVSVVILSHRPDLLPLAFDSAARQSYPNVEILVKYHREYWPEKFEESWRSASGEYLVFLPDDDLLHVDFVRDHVAAAIQADADLVYSDLVVMKDGFGMPWCLPAFDREVLKMHCVPWMTFLIRRAFLEQVGGWDGSLRYSDWDLALRCYAAHAKAVHLKRLFLWTRTHHAGAGSSLMDDQEHAEALRALRDKHP